MHRIRRFVCLICLTLTGCAVEDVRDDQDIIRCSLLGLYTHQILDNLVRAANGLPIIELDYTNASANVTGRTTAMLNDTLATTHTRAVTTAALRTLMTTRTTINTIMGSVGYDNTNYVTVKAVPVTSSVELYNAYLQFLTVKGSLQVGPTPPADGAALVWEEFRGAYYWVPTEFKDLFSDLALVTTAERGRLLLPPPESFSATLMEIVGDAEPTDDGFLVTVRVDQEVPNSRGIVKFGDGATARFEDYRPSGSITLFKTDRLVFFVSPNVAEPGLRTVQDLRERLHQSAQLRYPDRQPAPPTTQELLERIPFEAFARGAGCPMATLGSRSLPVPTRLP